MSALDAISPTVVYRWPDGWRVTLYVDRERATKSRSGAPVVPVVLTLRGTRYDDRWSVAHLEGDVVIEWSSGSKRWQLPEVPVGKARKKLLGFLLDLGVGRPAVGVKASLVTQVYGPNMSGDPRRDHRAPSVPYPRWVDDVRWEQRYEEALRFVLNRLGDPAEMTWQLEASLEELFLGHVENLEVQGPDFYSDDKWHATCRGQSECVVPTGTGYPESPYFHAVVDQLLDSELLLPTSSKLAWESEYVTRGEWVLPTPDEVEVYRMLGEGLPLLWGAERLLSWLWERP